MIGKTKAISKPNTKAGTKNVPEPHRSKVHVERKTIEWSFGRGTWSNFTVGQIDSMASAKPWSPELFLPTIHPNTPKKWSKMKVVQAGKRVQTKKVDPFAVSVDWLYSTKLWPKKAWMC
eukprot:3592782-Amphidinium_carterae.1